MLNTNCTTGVEIREASIFDAEQIASLGTQTYIESHGTFFKNQEDLLDYCKQTFSKNRIREELNSRENIFFVALVNNKMIAYAKVKLNASSTYIQSDNIAQLDKIYVLKDFLSMKIGLLLFDVLLKKIQSYKVKVLWLVVYHENKRAINFYLKNEFINIAEYYNFYGKEAYKVLLLKKDIKAL